MKHIGTTALVTLFAGPIVLCALADARHRPAPVSVPMHATGCAVLSAEALSLTIAARPASPAGTNGTPSLPPATFFLALPERSVGHPPERVVGFVVTANDSQGRVNSTIVTLWIVMSNSRSGEVPEWTGGNLAGASEPSAVQSA